MRRGLLALITVWLLSQDIAWAQADAPPATRAGALDLLRIAREQARGAERHPWLERALFFVEEHRVLERLNPPTGFYPTVGGVTQGSGLGVGLGYRRRPTRGRVRLDTAVAWTFRDYKAAHVIVTGRPMAGAPLEISAGSTWFDYTQDDFFGLGPTTNRADRVSYRLGGVDTFAQAETRKAGWLVVRGRVGWQRMTVDSGTDARYPSVEAIFTDLTAPGLRAPLTLTYAQASAGVDTRDQAGNTRAGGLYSVSIGAFRDRPHGAFDFNRFDLRAMQVIPIFDKKRGIALNATASRIDPSDTSRVPFYLMPTVGGASSLRGYRDFRFRDAAAVGLNAEYRWEAFSGLDLALFVDAGDVGPTWRSLVGSKLRTSWGGGFRFNTNRRVFLRVDIAGGREGTRVWATARPVFGR